MPTYEFTCKTCNKNKEVYRSMSDTSDILCDDCGTKMAQQIGSAPNFQFKGRGFPTNDIKKGRV